MILGASEIVKLIRKGVIVETPDGRYARKPLIEGLSEEQIEGIEGTTVDLRLGEILRPASGAELLLEHRVTPKVETLLGAEDGEAVYTLQPGELCLVQTLERVNLPQDLLADVRTRTTLFRCGLYLKTSFVSPNYQGVLTFCLKSFNSYPVKIQLGFRIATIAFMQIAGQTIPYRGVWQGKRASTNGQTERPY